MDKLKVKIIATMNCVGTTEFSFSLSPNDVNKLQDRFGFRPTNHIVISYDYNFSWGEYLSTNKKHIQNIISLGHFTDDEVEFMWDILY